MPIGLDTVWGLFDACVLFHVVQNTLDRYFKNVRGKVKESQRVKHRNIYTIKDLKINGISEWAQVIDKKQSKKKFQCCNTIYFIFFFIQIKFV